MISENLFFVVLSGFILVMDLLLAYLALKIARLRRDLENLDCKVRAVIHSLPPLKKDPTDA